jgi:retron-type reverse transcriptase
MSPTVYPFFKKVREKERLYRAWHKVYENGISSNSSKTRTQVKDFSLSVNKNIERINRQLQKNRFRFKPAQGIPISREGKQSRPIVKSPIPSRIVQRSILDVLQEEKSLQEYVNLISSFGGVKKEKSFRGVKEAVKSAYQTINNGAKFFICSDIKNFFRNIPRDFVLKIVSRKIPDPLFNHILKEATDTELENLAELGNQADLFPLYEIGVAQGCCLSPLIGNILLHEFDLKLNSRGIICLRYIDDFIILGPTQQKVLSAFRSAQTLLRKHGLEAYDFTEKNGKFKSGEAQNGFEFLGCDIRPGLIRPNKKSRRRLLEKINQVVQESEDIMEKPKLLSQKGKSFIKTLTDVGNLLRGWGNQYDFCNDGEIMNYLDSEVDKKIEKFTHLYFKTLDKFKGNEYEKNSRRLLGVHLLTDSKSDPIITKKRTRTVSKSIPLENSKQGQFITTASS